MTDVLCDPCDNQDAILCMLPGEIIVGIQTLKCFHMNSTLPAKHFILMKNLDFSLQVVCLLIYLRGILNHHFNDQANKLRPHFSSLWASVDTDRYSSRVLPAQDTECQVVTYRYPLSIPRGLGLSNSVSQALFLHSFYFKGLMP